MYVGGESPAEAKGAVDRYGVGSTQRFVLIHSGDCRLFQDRCDGPTDVMQLVELCYVDIYSTNYCLGRMRPGCLRLSLSYP